MKNKIIYIFLFMLFGCANNHVDYLGQEYLGVKYLSDPLGEEKAPDTDPLIRTDAFDCMTFVETSVAHGDVKKLTNIRYKNGEVDVKNRNHFTELDWLDNNKDLFENVSDKYGKTDIRIINIDKQKWFKKKYNIDVKIPVQKVELKYIPYANISTIKTNETLIVLFVADEIKCDKIGTDLTVIHVGFLLPNGMLRHASQYKRKVVDVDFYDYIQRRMKHKKNLGIALVKIK
jgi:hypothetical protein